MTKLRSKIVFMFAVTILLDVTKQECFKACNNNGFCFVENGIEKCKCLDRIYVGESCDELVDHCDENPCKNGGKCIREAGQYNCLCTNSFSGQNCTFKEKLFGQIYLQYNHISPVGGNDNHFLIILTDLGTVKSMVEMVTTGYAIAGGLTFPSDSEDFVQTNDIRAIAKQFNVPLSPTIPTGTVFYHAGKYRMSTPGIAIVALTIAGFSDSRRYYVWYFQFGSMKNDGCNPLIEIKHCGTPTEPVYVNVRQSVFMEANIQRDCGRDSIMSFNWSISDFFDTKTLQSFNVGGRSLKIPPFNIRISYNSEDVFNRLNLIRLLSLERSTDGTSGEALNRCYIFIITDKPLAKITGGEHQEYSDKQQILMDGSDSVDMSVHPKRIQKVSYSWRCSSSDNADEYCKNLNETGTFATTHSFYLYF